jgi:hypothetical protein
VVPLLRKDEIKEVDVFVDKRDEKKRKKNKLRFM